MNNKLDVGIKLLRVDDERFVCDGFYFISVDLERKVAKILSDNEEIDELPLIDSANADKVGIMPGLLPAIEECLKKNDTTLFRALEMLQDDLKNSVMCIDFSKFNSASVYSKPIELLENSENGEIKNFVDEEVDEEYINVDDIDIKKISEDVKKSIVGQDEVVDKVLSNIIFNQKLYFSKLDDNDARLLKKNMLIFGKTGTGKTEIIKQIAKRLKLPCVIEDATNYTIEGYKGKSVVDMIKRLVNEVDFDLDLAEHGILVVDEIDKKIGFGDDQVNSVGVLRSLLKIIESEQIDLTDQWNPDFDDLIFDSSFLTVICLGHFESLYKNKKRNVGFIDSNNDDNNKSVNNIDNYNSEEFINIGMPPEFMGRITDIIKTNDLDYEQVINIIKKSDISPLVLQKKFLDTLGVKLSYDDEFISELAKKVVQKKTGARAIKSCFEQEMGNITYEALSGDIKEVEFKSGKVRKIGSKE